MTLPCQGRCTLQPSSSSLCAPLWASTYHMWQVILTGPRCCSGLMHVHLCTREPFLPPPLRRQGSLIGNLRVHMGAGKSSLVQRDSNVFLGLKAFGAGVILATGFV